MRHSCEPHVKSPSSFVVYVRTERERYEAPNSLSFCYFGNWRQDAFTWKRSSHLATDSSNHFILDLYTTWCWWYKEQDSMNIVTISLLHVSVLCFRQLHKKIALFFLFRLANFHKFYAKWIYKCVHQNALSGSPKSISNYLIIHKFIHKM